MKDLYIIKDRLNEALRLRDMTPRQLADKSGLYFTTIYRYLNGDRIPKTDSIEKMAAVLRVSPSWLLGYDAPMTDKLEPDLIIKQDELTVIIEQLSDKDKDTLKAIAETLLKKSKEVSEDANTDI